MVLQDHSSLPDEVPSTHDCSAPFCYASLLQWLSTYNVRPTYMILKTEESPTLIIGRNHIITIIGIQPVVK